MREMVLMYYPPFWSQSAEEVLLKSEIILSAFIEELGTVEEDKLKTAWRNIVRTHSDKNWPSLQQMFQQLKVDEDANYPIKNPKNWVEAMSHYHHQARYKGWFKPLRWHEETLADEDGVVLGVRMVVAYPSITSLDWIRENCREDMEILIRKFSAHVTEISHVIAKKEEG